MTKSVMSPEEKKAVIVKFGNGGTNTGCPEVQVAVLTKRIEGLAGHFAANKKDHSSRRGLFKMIGQRRSLLKYLARVDEARYKKLIGELDLRK